MGEASWVPWPFIITSQGCPPQYCSDSSGPQENCCSPSSGQAAGRVGGSQGPQQNSNFPFISAAFPAILKGRCSAVGSRANWIWASTHSWAREGAGGGAETWGLTSNKPHPSLDPPLPDFLRIRQGTKSRTGQTAPSLFPPQPSAASTVPLGS